MTSWQEQPDLEASSVRRLLRPLRSKLSALEDDFQKALRTSRNVGGRVLRTYGLKTTTTNAAILKLAALMPSNSHRALLSSPMAPPVQLSLELASPVRRHTMRLRLLLQDALKKLSPLKSTKTTNWKPPLSLFDLCALKLGSLLEVAFPVEEQEEFYESLIPHARRTVAVAHLTSLCVENVHSISVLHDLIETTLVCKAPIPCWTLLRHVLTLSTHTDVKLSMWYWRLAQRLGKITEYFRVLIEFNKKWPLSREFYTFVTSLESKHVDWLWKICYSAQEFLLLRGKSSGNDRYRLSWLLAMLSIFLQCQESRTSLFQRQRLYQLSQQWFKQEFFAASIISLVLLSTKQPTETLLQAYEFDVQSYGALINIEQACQILKDSPPLLVEACSLLHHHGHSETALDLAYAYLDSSPTIPTPLANLIHHIESSSNNEENEKRYYDPNFDTWVLATPPSNLLESAKKRRRVRIQDHTISWSQRMQQKFDNWLYSGPVSELDSDSEDELGESESDCENHVADDTFADYSNDSHRNLPFEDDHENNNDDIDNEVNSSDDEHPIEADNYFDAPSRPFRFRGTRYVPSSPYVQSPLQQHSKHYVESPQSGAGFL